MDDLWVFAVLIGLAALIAFSIHQDKKPRTIGKPTMVPWMLIGISATAAELVTVCYALTIFLK